MPNNNDFNNNILFKFIGAATTVLAAGVAVYKAYNYDNEKNITLCFLVVTKM